MRKVLKYGVLGLLALTILTLPLYWPFLRMFWVFIPRIPAPEYATPATEAEARLQDIDYLSTLTEYDRSFSEEARSDFASKLSAMQRDAAQMTEAEFYLAIAEAVAVANNGHSNISYRPQFTEFNTIGARLYAFEDGLFVLEAAPDKAHLLGHRVIAVNGTPVDALQDQLARYKGGNTTWRKLYSTLLIESPELLAAAGSADSPEWIVLSLAGPTGEISDVRFEGLTLEGDGDLPYRSAWETLVPGRSTDGFGEWAHVLQGDGTQPPRYLTQVYEALSYDLDNKGLYIRALPGFTVGEESIRSTYKAILSGYEQGSLDYMVVDFRIHDGGDYTRSIAFAEAAPDLVKEGGDIYIITGPNTFSAAIVTVAMLKYYAGERGLIIGEEMGDREQFWAERGSSFRLPNSQYFINYATGYHDWENGCKGEPYCYTMNEMYEVPAGPLSPEVVLPQDFASYAKGGDVVMEWIEQRH